jgi:hypothetical protein
MLTGRSLGRRCRGIAWPATGNDVGHATAGPTSAANRTRISRQRIRQGNS